MSYLQFYRQIFRTFGYPLGRASIVPMNKVTKMEKALGVPVPLALVDYYLVAGQEKRFNVCFERLIPPREWRVDQGRLIFMEENQGVCFWACSAGYTVGEDPTVWQAVADDELSWFREHRQCSVFLAVMLHYQAVSGGMDFRGSVPIPPNIARRLRGWKKYGTINRLTAYSRQNQVVCLEPELGLLAAAKTAADLRQIEDDLQVSLQER